MPEGEEPTFVLRASDPSAPNLVRDWARARHDSVYLGRQIPGPQREGPGQPGERDQISEAFEIADRMDAWRRARLGVHS